MKFRVCLASRAPKVWLRSPRKRTVEHTHVLFLVLIIFVKLHIYLATMVANPKYDKVAYTGSYPSFASFYPYYLGEHANPTCRRLHLAGTTMAVGTTAVALASGATTLLAIVPVAGYAFAWVGHFFFEKNRPATFKHPLYSLMGDFAMWWEVATGQRAA